MKASLASATGGLIRYRSDDEGTSPTMGRMFPKSQDEPQDAAVSGQGHGWPVLGPTGAALEGTNPTMG